MKGMKKVLTISSKGQITLPKSARNALGLAAGKKVAIEVKNDAITLRRVRDIEEFQGIFENDLPQDAVVSIRELRDRE